MKKIVNNSIHNWVNNHLEMLSQHKGKWVAYTLEDNLIGVADSLLNVRTIASQKSAAYHVFFVNPALFRVRILPIYFRTVITHDWKPTYSVALSVDDKSLEIPMLIDSGADVSLISYQTGLNLGLTKSDHEHTFEAIGIGGGTVEYLVRDIDLTIDCHTIKTPVAWVQDADSSDKIVGREIIFDYFNIEFRQSEERIVFTPVSKNTSH